MSLFGVRKEFSDVNTPKTSISASAVNFDTHLIEYVNYLLTVI